MRTIIDLRNKKVLVEAFIFVIFNYKFFLYLSLPFPLPHPQRVRVRGEDTGKRAHE